MLHKNKVLKNFNKSLFALQDIYNKKIFLNIKNFGKILNNGTKSIQWSWGAARLCSDAAQLLQVTF